DKLCGSGPRCGQRKREGCHVSFQAKMPTSLVSLADRFDRLSLRERALLFTAVVAIAVTAWNTMVMDGLTLQERGLASQVDALQTSLAATSQAAETLFKSDPTARPLAKLAERRAALDAINARLASESAGLIPPSQMVQVIRDVLAHQHGLVLVSLKNLPMTNL